MLQAYKNHLKQDDNDSDTSIRLTLQCLVHFFEFWKGNKGKRVKTVNYFEIYYDISWIKI